MAVRSASLALIRYLTVLQLTHAISVSSKQAEQGHPQSILGTVADYIDEGSADLDDLDETEDCCMKWFDCSLKHEKEFNAIFDALPACPCFYHPIVMPYEGKYWDKKHNQSFTWQDVTQLVGKIPRQDPAKWCIEQEPEPGKLASQYCCYNNYSMLITRGSGAGTPRIVSPGRFYQYHELFDIQPWIDCKGDWTRYHAIRPPNNDLQCPQFPDEEEYQLQREQAQNY